MSSDILLTVNEAQYTTAEAVMRLMEVRDVYKDDEDEYFWVREIDEITLAQYVKDSVKDEAVKTTAASLMFEEMGLYLTDEELSQIRGDAAESYEYLQTEYDLDKYGITLERAVDLYTKRAYYDKVYNKLSEDIDLEISDSDTKVIEVNYVEIPLSYSINQAENIRTEVKNGTSFETVCLSLDLDPVMNAVIKKGDMPSAFESVAYALIDGELSEIVETPECMYIIQCVEDYLITESVANKNDVISSAKKAAFDEYYDDFAKDALLRFNDDVWDSISVTDL